MPNTFSPSVIALMNCGLMFCGFGSSHCVASEQLLADDFLSSRGKRTTDFPATQSMTFSKIKSGLSGWQPAKI
jgi:hypothetical protein